MWFMGETESGPEPNAEPSEPDGPQQSPGSRQPLLEGIPGRSQNVPSTGIPLPPDPATSFSPVLEMTRELS